MTIENIRQWLASLEHEHLVLGYGSLMNADSRQRFSAIEQPGILVSVNGFERAWVTRSEQEKLTYVGALANPDGWLNAQMISTAISPALAKREQDYQFVAVPASAVTVQADDKANTYLQQALDNKSLWICQTLAQQSASAEFPIAQTYIDTCLAGCLEQGGEAQARAFIDTTRLWSSHIRHDRTAPVYPRPGRVASQHHEQIDALLREYALV